MAEVGPAFGRLGVDAEVGEDEAADGQDDGRPEGDFPCDGGAPEGEQSGEGGDEQKPNQGESHLLGQMAFGRAPEHIEIGPDSSGKQGQVDQVPGDRAPHAGSEPAGTGFGGARIG